MSVTPTAELALCKRYPAVEGALRRFPLCELPTAVVRARSLERAAETGPLYVKRDDRSAEPYGGNKPRKLELILGVARARGKSRVLTFGALGTHHGFATALYAARAGLACELVLVAQPVDDSIRRKLRLDAAVGARLFYGGNAAGAALVALARLARHPRTEIVPTGGSGAQGALGFLNAGLELAEQVRAGELPEPARVYVALGTGGTAAGLAAGLALAGLHTQVVAVLVTDILPPDERRIERLARRALAVLARAGGAVDPAATRVRVAVERAFRGPGYGQATAEGARAAHLAGELAELRLDSTYTSKTLGALLARERGRSEPVVFWNTYAAREPELPLPDWRTLPRSFHRFFRAAE